MACLGSRSRGSRELEPCWSLVIRGAQHGQTGFRTAVDEQGHTWEQEVLLGPQSTSALEQGDLGYVHDVLPRTCRPTKRLKSTGQYESGSCNCWGSDAQLVTGFLHDLKEGSKCWLSCNVFSDRLYHTSLGCEKTLLTKAARALQRDEKKPNRAWVLGCYSL